jgi:3-deoxy-D-manno-octulosonic-acid transferase
MLPSTTSLSGPGSDRLSGLERIYAVLAPCVFGPSLAVAYISGATRAELRARVGRMPATTQGGVWLHGASAGEMAGAARLVTVLREHGYDFPAIFTAANRAGVAYISRLQTQAVTAALAPWDVPAWVSRAFDNWRPAALGLIETELWPLLVFEAHRRGVPVFSLSARIYPRDLPRYQAIRPFIAPTLRRISRIMAQNETERERFVALGAPAERCIAAGNLKHLAQQAKGDPARLRTEIGISADEPVIVFGSVHRQELTTVFHTIAKLGIRASRFVIAPRHLSPVPAILRQAAELGMTAVLRSRMKTGEDWRILILDTMGELREFYGVAVVSVIGGGFGKFGGHNPLEALEAGAPVLFGPHFDHFEHEARSLMAVTPQAVITSAEQLAAGLGQMLADEDERQHILSLQRRTLPDPNAVTQRYLDELTPYLTAAYARS